MPRHSTAGLFRLVNGLMRRQEFLTDEEVAALEQRKAARASWQLQLTPQLASRVGATVNIEIEAAGFQVPAIAPGQPQRP